MSVSQSVTISSPEVSRSLKEALYDTLNGILSPHQNIRIAAVQRIQALEVTEDFSIHLTEFTLDPEGILAVRQLASVLLKQYVVTHWCSYSDKFHAPETTENAKATIKGLLPHGLKESISKGRDRLMDDEQPQTIQTERKIEEVPMLVCVNRFQSVYDLTAAVGISHGTCHKILSEFCKSTPCCTAIGKTSEFCFLPTLQAPVHELNYSIMYIPSNTDVYIIIF